MLCAQKPLAMHSEPCKQVSCYFLARQRPDFGPATLPPSYEATPSREVAVTTVAGLGEELSAITMDAKRQMPPLVAAESGQKGSPLKRH